MVWCLDVCDCESPRAADQRIWAVCAVTQAYSRIARGSTIAQRKRGTARTAGQELQSSSERHITSQHQLWWVNQSPTLRMCFSHHRATSGQQQKEGVSSGGVSSAAAAGRAAGQKGGGGQCGWGVNIKQASRLQASTAQLKTADRWGEEVSGSAHHCRLHTAGWSSGLLASTTGALTAARSGNNTMQNRLPVGVAQNGRPRRHDQRRELARG